MAILIPDSAFSSQDITPGEKRFLRGLRDALDNSSLVWYQPKLPESKRPDVLLYTPELGLILYEVKDWSLSAITKADIDYWTLDQGGAEKVYTAPLKQVRSYFYGLSDSLKKEPLLLSKDPNHKGKCCLPIATVLAFPNIDKDSFCKRQFDKLVEARFILFKEDIQELGRKLSDRKLLDLLRNQFEPWWNNDELTPEQLNALRGILYPEITSVQKDKGGDKKSIILDVYQEQIAKKIGSGHQRIQGVAGSGKSLVLCAKLRYLLEEHPDWNILLTCYNISLASQLRYYLTSFSNKTDEISTRIRKSIAERVKIVHYHGLCNELFKLHGGTWPMINEEQVRQTSRFKDMEECDIQAELEEMKSILVGQELQKIALTRSPKLFDAILVDEAQDFHFSWMKSLSLLLNGKTNFLLLSEDPNQKIYPRKINYQDAGIDVVGKKIFALPLGYRSTREIVLTASRLVVKSNWDTFYKKFIDENDSYSSDIKSNKRGDYPQLRILPNYGDVCDEIATRIQEDLANGLTYADIGVLYLARSRRETLSAVQQNLFKPENDVNYIENIRACLATRNIPHYWLSQDRTTKSNYDQFRNEVTVSTIFSSKGLEFSSVYIVGLELYPWRMRNERENASILYVAMTRAKDNLVMYSTEKTKITEEITGIIAELQEKYK